MNRRRLIKTALYAAATLALPSPLTRFAVGETLPASPSKAEGSRVLRIVDRTIEVKGRSSKVFGLVQADGTPGLSLPAGSLFDVTLRNETAEPTIIHWHGLTPPWEQDGVGDAPLPLIKAKTDRQFRFPVGNAGTHW